MEVSNKQIFNLWDTNGRRSDILNALSIYLNILKEMKEEGGFDQWASFPDSLTQLSFYQKAIEQSPEVFKSHPQFDRFVEELSLDFRTALNKNKVSKLLNENPDLLETLDKAIEQRARHYTSNLVRYGLATESRIITPAGQSYLNGRIERDSLEAFLPLNDVNLILMRQLLKLRIYSKPINGERGYYSPFYVSLYLLLNNDLFDKNIFQNIVQGLNPYLDFENVTNLLMNGNYQSLVDMIVDFDIQVPIEFVLPAIVSATTFNTNIKNRKSGVTLDCYYDFYVALFNFVNDRNEINYQTLKSTYLNNKDKIRKAFCLGESLFDFGVNGTYDLYTFNLKNDNNPFLNTNNFNFVFYQYYEKSKYIDQIHEYSDTTTRSLGATGVFKFKPTVSLSNKKLFAILFNGVEFKERFFGKSTDEEYQAYEKGDNPIFGSNETLVEILGYSDDTVENIIKQLKAEYGASDEHLIKTKIETKVSDDFKHYIEVNYPKERIAKLLGLFSDRSNDQSIRDQVNPSATVPTIYEYIIGIAWYYISDKDFDLFDSLNMTLNADFEPEMHAGGGEGDIVINYDDKTVLLEMTLMNRAAQRRGEWEPVLRHSVNCKAQTLGRECFTFFIADELDYNTINIWRAVAAAPLKSTSGDETDVNGVIIMPFTNENIIRFINNSTSSNKIIKTVKDSFGKVPKITEADWHSDILANL